MEKRSFIIFLVGILLLIQHISGQTIPTNPDFSSLENKSFSNARLFDPAYRLSATAASQNFDVKYYRCEWQVAPTIRAIRGKVTSYFTITNSTDNITFDLSDTLQVDSITYHNSSILFQRTGNDALQLKFPLLLTDGAFDSVSIFYQGVPRAGTTFRQFMQTTYNDAPEIYTLSEPFGAKEWWPCKNGLDDKTDSIDIIISNPDTCQASSNGVNLSEYVQNNVKTSVWKHRYPIATYLIAFAVTNYTVLKDTVQVGNRTLQLVDYAYPASIQVDYFNAERPYTKFTLKLYSQLFGEYPFANEKYGFTHFGASGGMENQTNSFVIGPTQTLISHETGHQWFGDKITCGSWEDVWLNEGFATYCEILYKENMDNSTVLPTLQSLSANIRSLPDGSVKVDDTTSSSRIFNGRLSYRKGGYLLHMLRWVLGDSTFFRGIRRYLNDPLLQYRFAKTPDLKRNLEQESGRNLSSFFRNWYDGQGYPIYTAEWTQDSSNNTFVKINQSTSHSSVAFYDMPVPIQFKNNSRDTIIVFNNIESGQTFLVNPGFAADTAVLDPKLWLLSRNSTSRTPCTAAYGAKLFPDYKIQWLQNNNNWVNILVGQSNIQASPEAENIPVMLHLTGDGKDTVIAIKNIRFADNRWINAGFKVSNAFITTSCFLASNYQLEKKTTDPEVNKIAIFPVPAVNTINVSLKNPTDKKLSVNLYNASGQLIYKKGFSTSGIDELFSIPINNLPKAVYFIRLESESAITTVHKIIKL